MRVSRRMMRLGFILSVLPGLFIAAPSWAEVECGDTIQPGEVAVLTKDLTCDGSTGQTALRVMGPKAVLKMRGHTVTCDGINVGIRLVGSEAVLVGGVFKHGTISNCGSDGVRLGGGGGHHITKVTATMNGDDGFQINSSDNTLAYTRSIHNRFGYFVGGSGNNHNTFKGNLAKENTEFGFGINPSSGHTLTKNQAISNETREGFIIFGDGHTLKGNVAKDNGNGATDEGFNINGNDYQLVGNRASGNRGSGFVITSDDTDHLLKGNIAKKNQQYGIWVINTATSNTIVGNIAVDNTLVDLRDDNLDCDNNTWKWNWFQTSQTNPPDAGGIR